MSADPLDFLGREEVEQSSGDPLDFLGEDISRARSLASAPVKGLIRGAGKFSPIPSFGPIPGKMKERLLEQFLPTQERPEEEILEFAGENIPIAAMGEGGLVSKGLQALAGGAAKKGAKELNLPEWAQELIGGAGMMAPGALKAAGSKGLRASSKQQAVVDFLKDKGLSADEITPIIQDPKKLSWLSKGAFKYEKESPFLKGIDSQLKGIYKGIREEGKKLGYLEGQALREFESDFFKVLDDLPDLHKDLIKKPIENLMSKPIDYPALLDFKQAINHYIKDVEGGKAVVGALKGPTKRAQEKLSPGLFQEQELADKAYIGMKNFSKKMTKKNWEGVAKLGDVGKVVAGALFFNPAMMGIGVKGALAGGAAMYSLRKMLVSPRLQNMHLKIQEAVLKNNYGQAVKLAELMKDEIERNLSSVEEENNE